MRRSHRLNHFAGLWIAALIAVAWVSNAEEAVAQREFASPEDAVKALQAAATTQDKTALHEVFGPEFDQLLTGDPVQDAKNAEKFAVAVEQACKPTPEGDDKVIMEVGTNEWPMPVPLVKSNGQWHFDTAAGKEEIVARHIGKDELHAIGVCRAYVKAQQQFASGPDAVYALKFKSAPGKKDGLYWPSADNESASPFGPVLAEAQVGGRWGGTGTAPQPFHGYFFRILTRQGPAAPGGRKDYMAQGKLSGGFALVAYPAHWDQSGIMTFIVNQDGNVYERNLGEKTSHLARRIKDYNPDTDWKPAQDDGMAGAVSEKNMP